MSAQEIEHVNVNDRAHDCLCSLMEAGWDNFEITIPYGEERPYRLVLWEHGGHWAACVENAMCNDETMAEGEGNSPGEALWNVGSGHLGSAMPWTGDAVAIPARLMLLAAVLWADATKEAARADAEAASKAAQTAREAAESHARALALRDDLLDEASIAVW